MKIAVFGATGGSEKAALAAGSASGHEMTAFARKGAELRTAFPGVRVVEGDAMNPEAIAEAVDGQDAVIVALGIRENAMAVRLRGSRGTPMDIRSRGTQRIVEVMRQAQVRRLVVQSSYGVGETRERLGLVDRLVFAALLRPQIADTERQEQVIRDSGLEWVMAQPVHLTDQPAEGLPFASTTGEIRERKVSRERVGRFLVRALEDERYAFGTVALSGAA